MKKALMITLFALFGVSTAFCQNMVMVGGHEMSPKKNIVQNALNSKAHTTLVKAVKAAGLVKTLEGNGPFTVLAPTNAAFNKLPKRTVKKLMKPKNKAKLKSILTYHVIPGRMDFSDIAKAIKEGDGSAQVKTVNGGKLTFMMNGSHNIVVKDSRGHIAHIHTYNVEQSNGVIHVIDSVLMPGGNMKHDNMMHHN